MRNTQRSELWISLAIGVLLLLVIALRLAQPIQDGDLFWHLAYAQQMLSQHTLIPDATLYSWTPTSNAMIYCSWLSELMLYGLWSLGGLTAMFVLRYLAVLCIVALLWHHATRHGQARRPLTAALLLLIVLVTATVTAPKPELFSVLFTHLLLWLYFGALHADRNGRSAAPWLWSVPLLMVVWINSHGGIILAAPLMAAMLAGDWINQRLAPTLALSAKARRTLWLAWSASALATLATPYGLAYPRQLIADYALGATARPDAAWNNAYQGLFSAGGWSFHLPEYGAAMLVVSVWLVWRRGRAQQAFDATAALLLLVALPLYVLYLRSSYLLPAVFGYVVIALLGAPALSRGKTSTGKKRVSARHTALLAPLLPSLLALLLSVGLSARTVWETFREPEAFSWAGFGISHINPVEEAEWLAQHPLGPRLYNIFDSGGYLLWRLYPQYRVMVDSRSFPYLQWFNDQYQFTMGERFDSFLQQYRGDVAIIDLAKSPVWRNFLRSSQWRPVFLGTTAAIFVRQNDSRALGLGYQAAAGLSSIRNADTALRVFDFAVDAADWKTAQDVATQLLGPLRYPVDERVLAAIDAHRQAYQSALAGEYAAATEQLNHALARKVPGERDQAMLLMLHALAKLPDRTTPQAQQIKNGLMKLLEQRQ